jgi:hypothetical protein
LWLLSVGDGRILYSTNQALDFISIAGGLKKAFDGGVYTEINDLNSEEIL